MSDNGNPFDYYVRSDFGDEVRELARQAGDVAALQDLEGQLVQHHRPTLDAVEGVVEQTIDRAPTEAVGQFGNVVQAATFARGALELYALSVDKANHTSPSPRSVEKLRQAYEEQRHDHWGAEEPVRADYGEGGPRSGRDYEADVDAYEDDRHARKEEAMAGLSQEYWQLMANLDTDAGIVKSTFEQGPNPGILRGLVVYGVLPLEALASWPGVHLTLDEWKAYLIQRLTPADVLAPTADGLPLFTAIPPEYREQLLNDPEVMAAVAAGLDVDAEQGRTDAELLMSGEAVDGDQEQPLWDSYQRLAWIGAYASYAQANGGLGPVFRGLTQDQLGYLENFYTTATGDGLRTLNTYLNEIEIVTGDVEHNPTFKEVVANGLLALSDESIGGGYEFLPQPVVEAVEAGSDQGLSGGQLPIEAVHELARLLDDSTIAGGTQLSCQLAITLCQQANDGLRLLSYPEDPDDLRDYEDQVRILSLFDVASRNHQAMYNLITGENMDSFEGVYESGEEVGDYGGYDETEFLLALHTTPWVDDGSHASQLIDWIGEECVNNGPDLALANGAFDRYVDVICSTGENGIYQKLMDIDASSEPGAAVRPSDFDDYNSSSTFGGMNPSLALSIAALESAYLDSIVDSSEDPNTGDSAPMDAASDGLMDIGEILRLTTLGVTTDESAASLATNIKAWQLENMTTIGSEGEADAAAQNARLQAYFDSALVNEAMTRTADQAQSEIEAAERANRNMRIAAAVVRSFNPIDYDVYGVHFRAWQEQLWNATRYGVVQAYVENNYTDPTAVGMLDPHGERMDIDPEQFKFVTTYDLLQSQVRSGAISAATLPSNLVQGDPPQLRPLEEISIQQPGQHGADAPPSMNTVRDSMQDVVAANTDIDAHQLTDELWDTYDALRVEYTMDETNIDDFSTGALNF